MGRSGRWWWLVLVPVGGAVLWSMASSASETINYSYDAHGRLVGVVHTGTINNNVLDNYSYDAADNRVLVTVNGSANAPP